MKFKAMIPLMLSIALHAAVFSGIAAVAGFGGRNSNKETIEVELDAAKKAAELPDIHKSAMQDKIAAVKTESRKVQSDDGSTGTQVNGSDTDSALTYKSMILRRLQENRKYPPAARRRGIEGSATVAFTIMPDGSAQPPVLTGSSGQQILDDEAILMVKRAAPFPRTDKKTDMFVEVVFKLN